jgi:hypothetical protein
VERPGAPLEPGRQIQRVNVDPSAGEAGVRLAQEGQLSSQHRPQRRREPGGRQGQADPGGRVRLGGESRPVGRDRRVRVPADQEDVSLAEPGNAGRGQLLEPPRLLETHVKHTASGDGVDLPEIFPDRGFGKRPSAERVPALVGSREPGDRGGIERRVREPPGEPVVEGHLPGYLRRIGRHRGGLPTRFALTEHGDETRADRCQQPRFDQGAGHRLDHQTPAFVQHVGAQDRVRLGLQAPLLVPEPHDAGEGIHPLQDPAHGARVLAPRGVALLAARLDERQHVHQAAEFDVLELVDQGLGHAHRGRRQ